jgi:hypothetical protein
MANLLALTTSYVRFEPRPLRSTGITRFQHYYGPLRHPMQPGLSLTGFQLDVTHAHRIGLPVLRRLSICTHAVATTPAGPLDGVTHLVQRWPPSPFRRRVGSCIRLFEACSAFTHVTACVLAKSPKVTRCIKVLQRKSLPSSPALTATGWSDQLPDGTCTH